MALNNDGGSLVPHHITPSSDNMSDVFDARQKMTPRSVVTKPVKTSFESARRAADWVRDRPPAQSLLLHELSTMCNMEKEHSFVSLNRHKRLVQSSMVP